MTGAFWQFVGKISKIILLCSIKWCFICDCETHFTGVGIGATDQ